MRTTPKVWLTERKAKTKSGVSRTWQLKWPTGRLTGNGKPEYATETIEGCRTKAEAREARDAKIAAMAKGETPVAPPKFITLGVLRDAYLEGRKPGAVLAVNRRGRETRRKSLGPLHLDTWKSHRISLRYLVGHFGEQRQAESISMDEVDAWLDALRAGELNDVRTRAYVGYKPNGKRSKPPEESTTRKHGVHMSTVWRWAKGRGLVWTNPFEGVQGITASKPKVEVPEKWLAKIFEVCPSAGWKAAFALPRLGGLRRREALELPFAGEAMDSFGVTHRVGIDWVRKVIMVVGTHKGKRSLRYREAPIRPALMKVLEQARAQNPRDQISITGVPYQCTKQIVRLVRLAGLEPWADPFNAMRASCEDDWKVAGIAEATYTYWMGHGPKTSRKHYVQPTLAEIAAVTG